MSQSIEYPIRVTPENFIDFAKFFWLMQPARGERLMLHYTADSGEHETFKDALYELQDCNVHGAVFKGELNEWLEEQRNSPYLSYLATIDPT